MLFSRDSIASYLEFSRFLQFHILSSRVLHIKSKSVFFRASHSEFERTPMFGLYNLGVSHSGLCNLGVLHSGLCNNGVSHSGLCNLGVLHSGLYNLGVSHSGLCDPLVVFEGLVIVELVRMTLVILLPFQDGQQALNTEIYEVVVVVDLLTIAYGSHF